LFSGRSSKTVTRQIFNDNKSRCYRQVLI
jgi:hypothetical protein